MRERIAAIARGIGLEGVLVITGTACLAIFSSAFHALGPFAVTGVIALSYGIAIDVTKTRRGSP